MLRLNQGLLGLGLLLLGQVHQCFKAPVRQGRQSLSDPFPQSGQADGCWPAAAAERLTSRLAISSGSSSALGLVSCPVRCLRSLGRFATDLPQYGLEQVVDNAMAAVGQGSSGCPL